MRFYLLFIILFSNTALADVQPYVNPFVSDSQSNHFTVSATTGIVVPMQNVTTYPILPTTAKLWKNKTEQIDNSIDLLPKLQADEIINTWHPVVMVAPEKVKTVDDAIKNMVERSAKIVGIKALNKIGNELHSRVITKGVRSALLRRVSSHTVGIVGGVISAYGAYFLGYGDLKFANRSMVSSTASYGAYAIGGATLGATALLPAATSIAGIIGATAGTGTAISGLSGAALTNATLAWIGGGTLASGGGGMAAGTAVLAGISATGVGLIAVGIGAGVTYLYTLNDEKIERKRLAHLLSSIQKDLATAL